MDVSFHCQGTGDLGLIAASSVPYFFILSTNLNYINKMYYQRQRLRLHGTSRYQSGLYTSGTTRAHALILTLALVVICGVIVFLDRNVTYISNDPTPHERQQRQPPARVLLLSHGRVMWYDLEHHTVDVVHENQGIYYGGFPGKQNETVWIVSRPHNWRAPPRDDDSGGERLIEIDMESKKEIRRFKLDSRFTHDVVRKGNSVYVADTGDGHVIELDMEDMKEVSRMKLFTLKEHVNTLSPTDDGHIWAMLHNLGESVLAKIDLVTQSVVRRIEHVGWKSHGAVQWRDSSMVFLDSDSASLAVIDVENGEKKTLWSTDSSMYYLKGLCVIDDVAFFGIAVSGERKSRTDESLSCELAAFDLRNNILFWRRVVPTKGLLNVVAAPHLHPESTAKAVDMNGVIRGVLSVEPMQFPPGDPLNEFPPMIGGFWESGYPHLDNAKKNSLTGYAGGVQMLLYTEDVRQLKNAVLSMPDYYWDSEEQSKSNAFIQGREGQLSTFKPGTKSIHLIFSDRDAQDVFEFPWYREKFGTLVKPLLMKLLGKSYENIARVQFAYMPPHSEIKRHIDTGGYSEHGHRIHFVIASNPEVEFQVCEGRASECIKLYTKEGTVFELNNRLAHYVKNNGEEPRVHMVVDVAESPRTRIPLSKGQLCTYKGGKIEC